MGPLLELSPGAVYAVIAVLAAIENVFPPVPADTAVAVGAFVSTTGRISAWSVFWVTWASNVTSAVAVYALARHVGRPFFRGRLGRRLVRPWALNRLERLYERHGTWGIFVSRFIPGVRAVLPPFAGVAGLGVGRSVLPLVVASGIWYGTITFVAATTVREIDQITRFLRGLNRTAIFLAATVVTLAVVVGLVRYLRQSKKA